MNPKVVMAERTGEASKTARARMLGVWGEPLFLADWLRTVFFHYEVDAEVLQRDVPFELDLYEGKAYLSLVAFTLKDMRPWLGGKLTAMLMNPIATHPFLNARAYVKNCGEPGIHFLAEWLSNPLSVKLGPPIFGLPYRLGKLNYDHVHEDGRLHGVVESKERKARLEYDSWLSMPETFQPCETGTLDEFLLERYTAFTARGATRRFFRIWHTPWPQVPIEVQVTDMSLLTDAWPWFKSARLVGANYSPGVRDVWMGRPQRIKG